MPRKVREPFAYSYEHDGSLGIAAYPIGSRSIPRSFHQIGYVRPADGAFLSSPTFDDIEDYGSWERHPSLDEAVDFILWAAIDSLEAHMEKVKMSHGGRAFSDDAGRLRSLKRSSSVARDYSARTAAAMARASRLKLLDAAANMLRVSTYEEVMKTVSEAFAEHVMHA
jgi:hypothetical protein